MKRNRIIAIALFVLMVFTFAVSCKNGGISGGNKVDSNRTQLFVGLYGDGGDFDSAYAMAKRFENKYADYSFEEGKKGVQVVIIPARYSTNLEFEMKDLNVDVFFETSANANYLASKGVLMDLTDVYESPMNYDFVTGKTDPSGSSVLLKDKIRSDLSEYYQNDETGKYYGYPGTSTYYGLMYDIDLFEEENLYFAKNGGFVSSLTDERSAGPDGNYETTYDNGLPATYDEFFELCDRMVAKKITPVMWGGTVQEYMSSLLTALAADCDGKEQTELNYNYNGTATTLIDRFENGKPILGDPEVITAHNGYKLYNTQGRYYALKFLERLVSNNKYYNSADATNNAFEHTMAQDTFLLSKYGEVRQRTAMLVEGNWWQKEALGTFQDMEAANGIQDSVYTRRFGILPLPKPTQEKVGEPFTILERCVGDGFVNAFVPEYKINLAKSYVQFSFTDESCIEFLQINSSVQCADYDIGDAYDTLTPWGKTAYDISNNTVLATMYSESKIMQNYSGDLWWSPNVWFSKIGGTTYTYPSKAMIDFHVSAMDYFNGLQEYWTPTTWANKFTAV